MDTIPRSTPGRRIQPSGTQAGTGTWLAPPAGGDTEYGRPCRNVWTVAFTPKFKLTGGGRDGRAERRALRRCGGRGQLCH